MKDYEMNAFLLRSKHLKDDLEEMVQYKLTHLLPTRLFVKLAAIMN